MFRRSFLLRRAGSAWLLVGSLMVSVLVTAALISAVLSFYSAALPATVTRELGQSSSFFLPVREPLSGPAGPVTSQLTRRLRTAFGAVRYRQYASVWSNDLALPGPPSGRNVAVLPAAALPDPGEHATLTAGTWPPPGRSRPGQPIAAALPAAAAARLHLAVGSVLALPYVGSTGTAIVRLRVTGLFSERDPAAAYWRIDPLSPHGYAVSGGFASYGPAVVSPAAFGSGTGPLQPGEVAIVAVPDTGRLTAADLDSLATRLSAFTAAIQQQGSAQAATTMPRTLLNVAAGLSAARSLVAISGLELLLLAAAALALAGRLLARHRDEETALLAARGAGRWQLLRPSLTESVLACAIAAGLGAVAGRWLAGVLLSGLLGPGQPVTALGGVAWPGAALVLALCLAIAVWPALRPPAIAAVRVRRGRSATVASMAVAGADLAVIALAAVAVHELLSYSAAAGPGQSPVIIAAPALALAGLALVPLRLLPLAARGLERLTARGRRLGTALASWEISRRPVRQSGPALLVILAVGTATLTLAQYQSWQRSARDQAAFAAGADVRVSLASAQPVSGAAGFARLPGVTAAMPVSDVALAGGQLLGISAPDAAATVQLRSDLSGPVPVPQLWRDLRPAAGPLPGVVVPGRPARIAITASLAGGLADQLGPVAATLTVQDGYGLAYQLPAGPVPADGRPHRLVVDLGSPAGIAYPVRVIGLTVSYAMPYAPASARAARADATAVLTVGAIAASPAAAGPFGPEFASGRQLAGWRARTSAPGLDELSALLKGKADRSQQPSVDSSAAAGPDLVVTISPGHGPYLPRRTLLAAGVTSLPARVALTIPPSPKGVPLLATSGFLRAASLSPGSPVPVTVGGVAIPAYVRLAVSQFPTVTGGSAVVADEAALQDAVVAAGGVPLGATAWWLATASGAPPPGLPAGSTVVTAAAIGRQIQHNPVSAAPVRVALAVAAAAAVLAALGFCVSVAASARERRGQRALLAALGVAAGDQARLLCLEELMVSGPAAVVGVVIGVVLAHLLIPSLTLTATAGLPVPPVLVRVPVPWVVLVALVILAIPVVAGLVATLRQPDPAAELRAMEAAG